MIHARTRSLGLALLLMLLCGTASAGEGDRWSLSDRAALASAFQDAALPQPAGSYDRFVEVAFSDDTFELGYRQLTIRRRDYYGIDALVNDEGDFLLSARLVRQGQVIGEPLRLGVGVGAYGVWIDDPNESVYAVALIGTAEYDLHAAYPTTVAAALAVAPRIATFDDGEDLFELELRVNVDLSEVASVYVGLRALEVETETDEYDVDQGLHVGIRLAL